MNDRQRHPTRALTEGAILAALTVVVATVGLIAPFVGVLLAPLPIMLLVIRWGLRIGVLASAVAAVLLLQFFGPLIAAPVAAAFVPLGLALGWAVRRKFAPPLTILAGAAAFLCASIVVLGVFAAVLHLDPIDQLIQIQVQASQMGVSALRSLGAPLPAIEQIRAQWESFCSEHHCVTALMPPLVRPLFPLILALGALLSAYLSYAVARPILRRVGHELPGVPPLLAWRLNPRLASALVWSTAGLTLLSYWFPPAATAAFNATYAALYAFGFQGALVGITWMNRWRIPRISQFIAGILLLQVGYLFVAALMILGLLDTWFDYRRLAGPSTANSPTTNPVETTAPAIAPAARSSRSAAARRSSRQKEDRVRVVRPQ
jgi:uncharacterized protein YybS (DUF2232 family)